MIRKYLSFLLIFITIIGVLTACKSGNKQERNVSVSILPQKYFIERIAGDFVNVNVMIPPGMNPTTCDFSTEQLKKLYDSDICFTIGYLPFETTHLYPVLENKKDIQLVNHSDNIKLLEGTCGHVHENEHAHGVDPHIWLSPHYAKEMSKTILSVLSEKYPEQKAVFEANYEKLAADIDSLDVKARNILAGKRNKSFLIYHPALTYFVNDYGMEQISIENEGKEPNPAHLKSIIDQTKEKDIHIIFIQNQFDVNNAQSIAKETGGTIIPIDPLAEDWLTEMNHLLQVFNDNLN